MVYCEGPPANAQLLRIPLFALPLLEELFHVEDDSGSSSDYGSSSEYEDSASESESESDAESGISLGSVSDMEEAPAVEMGRDPIENEEL
ncbi:hypothetical protein [Singapore grouper iridovirus]|nr:hypothetical protein [Singapore grouper iridovirus]